MRGRVLVLDSPYSAEPVEQLSLPGYAVERLVAAELPERADDVVGLVVDMRPIDTALLDRFPALRCVSVTGIGLDAVDLDETARRGIAVRNVPTGSVEEVATHAAALALALVRRLLPYHRYVVGGGFLHDGVGPVPRLSELTVGILGFGRIGQGVAERLAPFGCRLTGYDLVVEEAAFAALGVEPLSLDDLLAGADLLTVHCPLTPETENLLDAERLGRLKRGALLVNTARGRILDSAALARALREGRLAGAALDVFRDEPPGAEELSLAEASDNVILTPHAAFYSEASERFIREQACRNLLAVLEGG